MAGRSRRHPVYLWLAILRAIDIIVGWIDRLGG